MLQAQLSIIEAIKGRACVRAFQSKPVDDAVIRNILEAARFAPSGVNTQPWRVAVVKGATKQRITDAYLEKFHAGVPANQDYHYYPQEWFEPYKSRRYACGMALYGALGIDRDDKIRRREVWELNYQFFGAPVGLILFVDARLEKGSWMDMGMFLQNVMLAARAYGLETCPQASLAEYPDVIRSILGLDKQWAIVCGVALGYPDREHRINHYRTAREDVDGFATWYE